MAARAPSKRKPSRRTAPRSANAASPERPSDTLRVAVTFPRPGGGEGVVRSPARLGAATVMDYKPAEFDRERALEHLERLGFRVTVRGQLSVSVRGSRKLFERDIRHQRSRRLGCRGDETSIPQAGSVLYPSRRRALVARSAA